ncbi:hypothetical protein ISS37_00605 [candidate division KSB1 bacterium]|nr:hypothetical protein [candidate division KSB1 bacterium]
MGKKYAKILSRSYGLRRDSDYVVSSKFAKETVEGLIVDAEDFTQEALKFLGQIGKEEKN